MPLIRPAQAAHVVNRCIRPLGVKVVRASNHDWSDTGNFIPLEPTVDAARAAGMTVGDYVENVMNGVPGTSRTTIDAMTAAGVFDDVLGNTLEIGPGTGRYLSKTLSHVPASSYEIYETSVPWRDYLLQEYGVIPRETDGYHLGATPDSSVHLAQAHKVFSTIPFMATCSYWAELVRVVRPGGWVVFDLMTEDCLGAAQTSTWAASGIRNGSFPAAMPIRAAVSFFAAAGYSLVNSDLIIPMPPGLTQVLMFRRDHAS